jgi:hypothetical protein
VLAIGSLSRGTRFIASNSFVVEGSHPFVDFVEAMILSGASMNILMRNGRET